MRLNKKIITILILTILLSITAVNAENTTNIIEDTSLTPNTTNLTHNNTLLQESPIKNLTYPTDSIYVDPTQTNNGDGSQSNPFKDIKTAINSASTDKTIILKTGTYTGENNTGITINTYGLKIYGENAIINFAENDNPFTINNKIYLFNISFTNSQNSTLIINSNEVTIEYCNFINNTGETGGAIYWKGSNGKLTNSTFISNSATLEGGAIQLDAANNNQITGNLFENNTGDYGGAICIANAATRNTIEYNAFINNKDFYGYDVNINTNNNYANSINNNWWSTNTPNFQYFNRYITDFTPETWIILNFTNTTPFSSTGGINTLVIRLNTIYNKTSKTNSQIPEDHYFKRTVNLESNIGTLNPTTIEFINTTGIVYTYPASSHILITATVDNQKLTLTNTENNDSFKDLYQLINEATNEINLTKNYTFNINYDLPYLEGINIDKTLTINGNGYTINGLNKSRIFNITSNNVKINNITFTNGYNDVNGGSIHWTGSNGIINNSLFTNNNAFNGGSIYSTGDYLTIINTTFTNNHADKEGGAIYLNSNYANIQNTTFTENSATYYGGAIYTKGKYMNITNSTFTKNNGEICGGALHLYDSNNAQITGNIFTQNNGGTGGAICFAGDNPTDININNNIIVNNTDWYENTGIGTFYNSFSNLNLNDNWWGENNPTLFYLKEYATDIFPETWIVLTFTKNDEFSTTGGSITLTAKLNTIYNTTTREYTNLTGYLPNREITFEANLGSLSPTSTNFTGETNTTYTYPAGTNDLLVSATVDNQKIYIANFEPTDTYTILQGIIDTIPEGGELNLTQNYTYSPIFDTLYTNGMKITKPITINGNGYTLNSIGQSRIFQISANDVKITNLNLINGNNTDYGGAIYWMGENGILTNSTFTNNTASSGGAILWEGANGKIINSTFTHNTGDNGGAVSFTGYEGIINNTIFTNNTASSGGALSWDWASNGLLTNSTFIDNTALGSGGAITWSGVEGKIENIICINNKATGNGGAIEYSALRDGLIINSTFINNTAGNNGGGVSWSLFRGNGTTINSTFIGNNATNGGAYYWGLKGNGTIINTIFINNTANEGGAVLWYYGDDGTITNSTFIGNKATVDGGAVQSVVSQNFKLNNSTFIKNHADETGGAILFGSGNDMTSYVTQSTFIENTATSGGGIYNFGITGYIENNTFTNNTVTSYGGAIYLESGILYNITNNNFTGNNATRGGAIYLAGSTYTAIIDLSQFNNNNATDYAGAIMNFNTLTTILNSNFTNNKAPRGGAVACSATNNLINNSTFTNNTATLNGGAIYWNSAYGTLTNSTFTNNKANSNGGAIYWNGANGNINNCNFTRNNATFGGAIVINAENHLINQTNFINNTATNNGIIYQNKEKTQLINTTFYDNNAISGAIIYTIGELNITESTLTNNTANNAIIQNTKKLIILNSKLTNNKPNVLIYNTAELNITGSIIINPDVIYNIYNAATASAEYNWWGNNTPDFTLLNYNVNTDDWIILNASLTGNIVTATLNTTQDGNPLPTYINLPNTSITFNSTTGTLNPETNTTTNMQTTTTYTPNKKRYNITITLDNEEITITGESDINIWYVDSTQLINGDGSEENPFKDIKSALNAASENDTIIIREGTYTGENNTGLTISANNLRILGENATIDFEEINGAIIIDANNTLISGLKFINASITAIVNTGITTIVNSKFIDNHGNNGGALNTTNNLTIINCTFYNNSAIYGGSIYSGNLAFNPNQNMTCYIFNSTFTNDFGVGGSVFSMGNLIIDNSSFYGAKGTWSTCAIYSWGNLFINNSIFTNNSRAILNIAYMNVINSIFINNSVKGFNNSIEDSGGAISTYGCNISNCIFINNFATTNGGAIYSPNYRQYVNIYNSSFVNNSATNGSAIYAKSLNVYNSSFINCHSYEDAFFGSQGGALYTGDLNIYNSSFVNNSASSGGCIWFNFVDYEWYGITNFNIYNSSFVNNSAWDGGVISTNQYLTKDTQLNIINSILINNSVMSRGGAIYTTGCLNIINSTLSNNSAKYYGGAVYLVDIIDFKLINSTISDNFAGSSGGAIYENTKSFYKSSNIIKNSTFVNNTAIKGAVLYQNSDFIIEDSEFINNNASEGILFNLGYLIINNSSIKNNYVEEEGILHNSNTAYVFNSSIENNAVDSHGGIIYNELGTLYIINSTLTHNEIWYDGIIYNLANLLIIDSSLINNNVGYGPLVYNENNTLISNSILRNNTLESHRALLNNSGEFNISGSIIVDNNARYIFNDGGIVYADYNWWGNNTPDFDSLNHNANVWHWIILNASLEGNTLIATLNTTQEGEKLPDCVNLPTVIISFDSTTGILNPTRNYTTNMVTTTEYTQNTGIDYNNISIALDNEIIYLNTINKTDSLFAFINSTYVFNTSFAFGVTLATPNNTKLANKTIFVTYDNITTSFITDNTGFVRLSPDTWDVLKNLSLGNNIFYFYFPGDEEYNAANYSGMITLKLETHFNASNINVTEGDPFNFTIFLKDNLNNPVREKINIIFENTTFSIVIGFNDNATLTSTQIIDAGINLTEGTYIINYNFLGDNTYLGSFGSNYITILPIVKNTTITAENINLTTKDIKNFTITLKDNTSQPLQMMTIKVTFNNETIYYLTNNNGEVTIPIYNLKPGEYNITYNFNGTNKYLPSNGSNIITVTETIKNTTISATNIITDNGTDENFTITLKDENNILLSNMNITVNFNGTTNNYTTDINGQVKINLKNLKPGTYIVNYTFNGTKLYTQSANSNIIIINEKITKLNTNITAENITITNNTIYNYIIKLTDENGNPIIGENIIINFNNTEYYKFTDNNGEVNLILNKIPTGTYNITYNYTGSKYYNTNYGISTINVTSYIPPKTTSIKASDITMETGEDKTLTISLTDIDGVKLTGQNIIINFNGTSYTCATDSNGEIIINLTGLTVGNYTINYLFNGTDEYYSSFASNKITVLEKTLNTFLIGENINTTNTTLNYTIILIDEQGNNLTNKEIHITFNGTYYNSTTDPNGKISIELTNLTPGTYIINYTFDKEDNYLSSTNYSIINIYKVLKNTTIETNLTNNTFTIKLTDNETQPLSLEIIELTINNETTYLVTDVNGEVTVTLNPGEYNITYQFNGTSEYYPVNGSTSFNISTTGTIITGDNITISENNITVYTITLFDENNNRLSGKTISINLNNTIYTKVTDSNGEVSIIITNLSSGVYNITYNFTGDVNYNKSSGISTINITPYIPPKTTNIKTSDVTIKEGENKTLTIILLDIDGIKLPNQNITINFNGTTNTYATNLNGEIIINLSNLTVGNYTINYFFNGTDEYYSSFASNTISVLENTLNTFIFGENINTTNTTLNYTIRLTDEQGNNLTNKQILISFNNDFYTLTTDSNGNVNLELSNLTTGTYIINYTFQKETNYLSSSNYSIINIYKVMKNTTFETNLTNNTFTIQLNDNETNPLSLELIELKINNETIFLVTDVNGEITLNLSPGEYNITYRFNGTSDYYPVNGSTSFNISTIETIINGNNLTLYSNENTTFTITLTDINGNPLKNQTVTVSFNNTITNHTTNNLGQINILISNLTENNYTINYTFAGTKEYSSSNGTNQITVLKYIEDFNTTISATDLSILTNETIDFTVTLKDVNGNLLANQNVTFQFNNTIFVKTTDSNGQANITLSNLTEGVYSISYGFAGSTGYLPSYSSNIITVTQSTNTLNTYLTADNITVSENDLTVYTITLFDENNNRLSGKTININLNNTIYTKVTDSNGEVSIIIANLSSGVYNITYNFTGDSNYNKSGGISTINVTSYIPPKTTSISGKDLTITNNDNTNFKITLMDIDGVKLAGQNVTINFNGTSYTCATDSNGEILIYLTGLTVGNYTINYLFNGTNEYYSSFGSNNIMVIEEVLNTFIFGENINITTTTNYNYTINLIDELGNKLTNKQVLITFNGAFYNLTTNSQGQVNITLSNLNPGTYIINYTFQKENKYSSSTNYSIINVYKVMKNTTFETNLTNNTFTIKLTDNETNPLSLEIIELTINNETTYLVTDVNGEITLNLSPGEYNITYQFNGTNEYSSINGSTSFNISTIETIITGNDLTLYSNENTTFTITLTDINGNPLKNQTITVSFNNITNYTTNNLGQINILITNLNPNNYTINYTFDGTNEYSSSTGTNQITVLKFVEDINTTISATDLSILTNETIDFTVTLKDVNGNLLANQNVTFQFNNTIFVKTTDSNGQANITLSNLAEGVYGISYGFAGSTGYLPSCSSNIITVTQSTNTLNTYLNADNITVSENNLTVYTITLFDENNNRLSGKTININLNNTIYTKVTDSNGEVSIIITNLSSGVYNITYNFTGDVNYNKSNGISTINITPYIPPKTTNIKASDITLEAGEDKTLTISLTDITGVKLAGQNVTITFNGKTYTCATDSNGEILIYLTGLTVGNYTINYLFNGTDEYYSSFGSNKITVLENTINTFLIGENINITSNTTYNYTIELIDELGNKLTNKQILITFNDAFYNLTTNPQGQVNLIISNLNPGTYIINYTFQKENKYLASTNYSIINVHNVIKNTIFETNLTNNTLTIKLIDNETQPLSLEIIELTINNQTTYLVTDNNGEITINLTPDEYNITYRFNGTGNYLPANGSTNFKINPTPTKITGNNITIYSNENTTFTITLTDNLGNPLKNQTITVSFNNITNYTTNNLGQINILITNLTPNNYTINYTFAGTKEYYTSNGTNQITILEHIENINTQITTNDLNILSNETTDFIITLKDYNNNTLPDQNITITFNNNTTTKTTDNNGKTNIIISNLNPGTYIITTTFKGSAGYLPSYASNIITVTQSTNTLNTYLTADNITINENNPTYYTITLYDENNNKISGKTININLNNTICTKVTDSNGEVSIIITNLSSGVYNITYNFAGDVNYNKSGGISTINITPTITPKATTINGKDITITNKDNTTFTITLTDILGNPINNATIIINFNNTTFAGTTNKTGQTSINLNQLKPETYTISYLFNGTPEYYPSFNKNTINVTQETLKTQIIGYNTTITTETNTTYKIKLIDENNNTIPNQTIIVNFNNTTNNYTTNNNGEIQIPLKQLEKGTYTIKYFFNGTEEYQLSYGENTIKVIEETTLNTTITAPNINLTTTETKNLTINLKDQYQNPIINTTIIINFNNKNYTQTTDNNGQTQFILTNLNNGTYTITYTFKGTKQYNSSTNTSTIIVTQQTKTPTKIIATDLNTTNTNTTFNITLTNNNNTPIPNQTITVNLNNNTNNYTTDNNGEIQIPLNNLNTGTYTITYFFNGTPEYQPSQGENIITITENTKENTTITGYDTAAIKNETSYFTITLTDTNNTPLNNQTITVNLNNQTTIHITDNNGEIQIPLKQLEKGVYTITYTYNGDNHYNPSANTNQIFILEPITPPKNDTNTTNTTNITINTQINTTNLIKYYQSPTPLQGTLTTINNTPLSNQTITITITKNTNNATKTYTLTTNNKGEFSLPINLANGTYHATIKYNTHTIDNITYNNTEANITIKVNNPPTIINQTTITTTTYQEQYNTGHSFHGTLTTLETNKPIPNQTIQIQITKTTNHATKTYTVTTNTNGEFSLPINLAPALYIVHCTYLGTNQYQPTTNYNTITVYEEM